MSHAFLRGLSSFGNSDAVVFDGKTYGYAELLDGLDDWRDYLDRHDVRPGQVVALDGRSSPHTCAGLLALVDRRAIAVPLNSPAAAKRAEFLDIAEVEVVITVDDTGDRHCEHRHVLAGHELYRGLRDEARPGLVLFSSGTTGRSKASVLDFDKLLAKYGDQKRGKRILSFLNLDHIGGINTLFHTLSQGGTVVTVAERTPDQVFATIAAHRVGVLPTTPTFLNMVLISGALGRHSTESLRLITYGTEPMPELTLRKLTAALPNVRFKQTYGLSELGILPTRSRSDGELWFALGDDGFRHKIVDNVLWIKSDMAMLGYLNAPAPFDDEGFFNTQDVVETDGDYIRVLGRRSEIINVGGEKVYPAEVENLLLEIPNVVEATVSGHPSPVTGMVVKATVRLAEHEAESSLRERIRAFSAGRLEPFKVPALIEVTTRAQHSDRFKKVRSTV
ncbi:class I adenylate-forming enzyme family protein [Herbihabitans rhizosphaerae]|uniref:class I adenylate-forming enzyme family protein n=1 Tax=Herbihabitans rhizosphaerae TaxID=1872711 RepID=UPI001A92B934|nr:fatty acid--CoA ligase family protein [Herbihabitans rhizosphaerae]